MDCRQHDRESRTLAITNLGFAFLRGRAGFEVGQSLISYSSNSTYGRALVVGFLNTLLVAVTGIITATIIGFIVGIGRLSHNWLIAQDLHGLCRSVPQHPAAAGYLLLVFRRSCRVLPAGPRIVSACPSTCS